MLYDLLKMVASVVFNLLNIVLGGRLPPFGTAAVVVEQEKRYLVVQLPRGRVVFPGGFMHWREKPGQAAIREGREETGLSLQAIDLIACYSSTAQGLFNMSTLCFVYSAQITGGTLRNNIEGRPVWMDEDELRKRMDKSSLRILDDYLQYRSITQEQGLAWSERPLWRVS